MPGPSWLAGSDPNLNNPLAKFIQLQEGWHDGSVSQTHNNPGNLKFVGQPGAVKGDPAGDGGNYAKFPDYKTGLAALNKQISLDASRGLTFRDFAKKYAPAGGGNDPERYAADLAKSTGHKPEDPIATVQPPTTGKPTWLRGANGQQGHTQAANGTPIVPPAASFQYIGNVLHRGVDGGLRAIGLPDTSDPRWKNPIRASDIPAALNPWNLIKGTSDTQVQEVQKGADALNRVGTAQGIMNKVGAATSALGHGVATLVPPLAPLADAQDRTAKGDIAGGLTQGVASAFGGELMNRGLENAAGRVSGSSPVPSDPMTGEFPAAPKPLTPEEANFQKSAKPIIEATQPGAAVPKLTDSLRTVLPEYKSVEPLTGPITMKNRKAAGDLVEGKYNQNFHNYLDPAIDRGQKFDGQVVRDEKMAAIPASLRPDPLDDPTNPVIQAKQKQYQALVDDANSWDRKFDAQTLYDRLQQNNVEGQKFHDMTPDAQYAAEIAGRPLAQVHAEGVGLRKVLYQGIDPETNGANVAENQGRYSDAITFRQHMDRLDNRIAQQPTPTTLQQWTTAGSDIAGLFSGKGAEMVKRRALEPDTLNDKVAKAFAGYKGDPLPRIPDAPGLITPKSTPPNTDFTLQSPSGNSRFSVQRDLFGGETPAYDQGSEVGSLPFLLQRTDPKTFDWQRALFPEVPDAAPAPEMKSSNIGNASMPERPVQPPVVNP